MRVLLTEDDVDLANITALNLKKHGFAVDTAHSGKETLLLLEDNGEYDVGVLDLNLPDVDGMELLKSLKLRAPNLPILALTARNDEESKVSGIKKGFDDYMAKPFSHQELAARLRVLYRSYNPLTSEVIEIGDLQIHPEGQRVLIKNAPVKLTLNEFRLLYHLAQNSGRRVSKKELLQSVWDRNSNNGDAKLITTISRLRKKIGDTDKSLILTCQDGYAICPGV